MRRREKEEHEKGFLFDSPNMLRKKKMLLFSVNPLTLDRQEWLQSPIMER